MQLVMKGLNDDEINDFERQMVEKGTIVLKILAGCNARRATQALHKSAHTRPLSNLKSPKKTGAIWRKAKAYTVAANEMFTHTNTSRVPWHVLPANDKRTIIHSRTPCDDIASSP